MAGRGPEGGQGGNGGGEEQAAKGDQQAAKVAAKAAVREAAGEELPRNPAPSGGNQPLAYQTGDAFNQMWDNTATDMGRGAHGTNSPQPRQPASAVCRDAGERCGTPVQGMVGQLTNQVSRGTADRTGS